MINSKLTSKDWLSYYKKAIICEYEVMKKLDKLTAKGLKEFDEDIYNMFETEALTTSKLPRKLEQLLLEGNVI